MEEEFELSWEDVSGRNDPKQRFRLYRLHGTDEYPHLLATCETEEAVGVTLCQIAREGQLDDSALGIIDTQGEKGKRWLLLPWLPALH